MAKKIPTYSICNLLGADRCMNEIVVIRISDFVKKHRDIIFPHRHDFYQIVLFTQGGGSHGIDFQTFEVRPHQIYYMAPGQIHTWNFDAARFFPFLILALVLVPILLAALLVVCITVAPGSRWTSPPALTAPAT